MNSAGNPIPNTFNPSPPSHGGEPQPGNNLSNTSVQTPGGISAKLVYTFKDSNHYIRFIHDDDGELITRFRRDQLMFCDIDNFKLKTKPEPVHALNLKYCINKELYHRHKVDGVWIPDVRGPLDNIKNADGKGFIPQDGKILVFSR